MVDAADNVAGLSQHIRTAMPHTARRMVLLCARPARTSEVFIISLTSTPIVFRHHSAATAVAFQPTRPPPRYSAPFHSSITLGSRHGANGNIRHLRRRREHERVKNQIGRAHV